MRVVATGVVRDGWMRRERRRARAGDILARARAPAGAGLAAGVLILRMAWDAGGYFPPAYLANGAAAFAVCAVLLAVRRPRHPIATNALVALAALSALAAWTGLSALWSAAPERAIEAMQRDLVYVGLVGLGLLAAGSGRYARQLVWGVLAVVCVVCGAALITRLYPDVLRAPRSLADENFRLSYPLTYWNSLGTMAAFGALLSFGLAADPRTWWPLRGVAAGLSVALAVTMYFSLSRGAWMALFAGLVVVVLLSAHRGSLLLTAGLVATLAIVAISRAASYPALVDNPAVAGGQEAAGHAFAGQLWGLVALAAGVQAFIGKWRASPNLM
jgi:hypothetical protein